MFNLDPRLADDCHFIIKWPLSQVLLMDDQRYPWLILVPTQANVCEPFELSTSDQMVLCQEASALGAFMKTHFKADKMNIGALGNVVSQLHVHVIARHHTDATFPGPVWGVGEARRYPQAEREALVASLREALSRIAPDASRVN